MKKNKYNRRLGAFNRLEDQIKSRRLSIEFSASIEDLSSDEKEKAILLYWDRKDKEFDNLKKKIS